MDEIVIDLKHELNKWLDTKVPLFKEKYKDDKDVCELIDAVIYVSKVCKELHELLENTQGMCEQLLEIMKDEMANDDEYAGHIYTGITNENN